MEDENRRSGMDRRQDISPADSERRNGIDRRNIARESERMIEFFKRIPLFNGLTNEQYMKILYICYNKTLPPECFIFERGERAESLFVLLKGKVRILVNNNTLVSIVEPVMLFGDEGFYTGKPRQTSAVTSLESVIIKINKNELSRMCLGDNSLCCRLQTNIIQQLSMKIERYTEIIQELRLFRDNTSL